MPGGRGGAVLVVARQRLRRRRTGTALLLVVTGLASAAPMALWSASRQTASAVDRFVTRADVPHAIVFVCPASFDPAVDDPDAGFARDEPEELAALRSIPGVTAAARFGFRPVELRLSRQDTGTLPAGLGISTLEAGAGTATVVANLAAGPPSRRTTRRRPADALRAE